MTTVDTLHELTQRVGESLGVSDWLTVDQSLIDRFADVTGDRNWYHVDTERAAREMPNGKTLAHGLLTLSLVPGLAAQVLNVRHHGRALNYGLNKVRFPTPVPVGSRVRLHVKISSATQQERGVLLGRTYTMELEGDSKPAMIADMLTLVL